MYRTSLKYLTTARLRPELLLTMITTTKKGSRGYTANTRLTSGWIVWTFVKI